MTKLLKLFGNGFAFIFLSPFFIAVFLLNFLYALIIYVGYEIVNVLYFFLGKKIDIHDDPQMRLLAKKKEDEAAHISNPAPTIFVNTPPYYYAPPQNNDSYQNPTIPNYPPNQIPYSPTQTIDNDKNKREDHL